jgi:hypothetical protein
MKIVVTHTMPDLDAVTSVWLIKRFLQDWSEAEVGFVPAGTRLKNAKPGEEVKEPIEKIGEDEVIHVDTGMGPLDHHQIKSDQVCGASRTWDYIRYVNEMFKDPKRSDKIIEKEEAISRMVQVVVDVDHFKEVFRPDPSADYQDFSIVNVLDGLKLLKPDSDLYYVDFMLTALDALLRDFENKIWAEKEIENNSVEFESEWGKALGMETINDDVIKTAQLNGFALVVRKDPRKGYVRIKASPKFDIDLTNTYEKLKKIDPDATWFLHVSRKMLLNGTPKNPKMKPTTLKLDEIISILKK